MATCEWGGSGNSEIEEATNKECPIRVRYECRGGIEKLSGIDPICEKHSANGFENEEDHFVRFEYGRQLFNPALYLVALALSNSFH